MSNLFGFLGTLALTGSNIYQAELDNRLAVANAQAARAAEVAKVQTFRYDIAAGAALFAVGFVLFKTFK